MRQRAPFLALFVVGAWLPFQGCAIDFDAPFADSTSDASTPVGGSGGTTDTGGAGGASGDAGAAGAANGGAGGSAGTPTGGTGGTAMGGTGGTGGTATGGTGGTAMGGTGGTAMGGTGGTGGTQIPTENCSNGDDDDGDELTDCADPDCQDAGYACVPLPPNGWTGLIDLRKNAVAPPPCDGLWEDEYITGGMDLVVPSGGTCPSCTCATSTNAQCGMDVSVYDQLGCAGNTQTSVFVSDGQCVNIGMQAFGPKSVRPTSDMKIVSGSCAPQSSGSASFPDTSWTNHARACQPTNLGGGCTSNNLCAPPTANGLVCVARTGQHNCPSDYSAVSNVVYQSIDDGRSCTACACGTPVGSCMGASISVEDPSGGCPGTGTTLTLNQCVPVPIHSTQGTFALESWVPGGLNATCTASGGATSGSAVATSPITICCRIP